MVDCMPINPSKARGLRLAFFAPPFWRGRRSCVFIITPFIQHPGQIVNTLCDGRKIRISSTSPQILRKQSLFVLQPDSFLVFIRFILCEAMSYFSPVRWIMNIVSAVWRYFRFIFAIHSNIWEFGLDVKRKRAIAGYLSSYSSHHASCAHKMA